MGTAIGDRVRELRYARGLGPEQLAGRAGLSRTAVYEIESGKVARPRASTLARIAAVLGVEVGALTGSQAEPPPRPEPSPATSPASLQVGVDLAEEGSDVTVATFVVEGRRHELRIYPREIE